MLPLSPARPGPARVKKMLPVAHFYTPEREFVPAPLRIPTIACAVIRCGTSRAVLVNGEELPGGAEQERLLYRLMAGGESACGLGGEHYQLNKVAVVNPTRDPNHFAFRFYQVDRAQGRMASDMECANVAAGAGLFASVMGLAAPDADGIVRATNAGTGQAVELSTVLPRPAWSNQWRVLFRQDAAALRQRPAAGPLVMSHPDGRAVDYWVLERGNVFVLANAAPEAAEPELLEQLASAGGETALALGSSAGRAALPKVILYSVRERGLARAVISAACFFNGEMHNSLPGSGAMCLSSFLAASHLSEVRPQAARGTLAFRLLHPSGALTVNVHWEAAGQDYEVVATDFVTPVQLLVLGGAVVPPPEEGQG